MTHAELLARIGGSILDAVGYNVACVHDRPRGLLWVLVINATAVDGAVIASVTRRDPGDLGRALFAIWAKPRAGRYRTDCATLGGTPIDVPLPVACTFLRAVRDEIEAEQPPDFAALVLRHLGVVYEPPSIMPFDPSDPPPQTIWFGEPE